jgi:hypothetical protein
MDWPVCGAGKALVESDIAMMSKNCTSQIYALTSRYCQPNQRPKHG